MFFALFLLLLAKTKTTKHKKKNNCQKKTKKKGNELKNRHMAENEKSEIDLRYEFYEMNAKIGHIGNSAAMAGLLAFENCLNLNKIITFCFNQIKSFF